MHSKRSGPNLQKLGIHIVNNRNTDRSLEIALHYAQQDSRILVHDNMSSYLCFLDSLWEVTNAAYWRDKPDVFIDEAAVEENKADSKKAPHRCSGETGA